MKSKPKKIIEFIIRSLFAPNDLMTSFSFTSIWMVLSNIIYGSIHHENWVTTLLINNMGLSYFWGTIVFLIAFFLIFELIYQLQKIAHKNWKKRKK